MHIPYFFGAYKTDLSFYDMLIKPKRSNTGKYNKEEKRKA